MAKARRKSKHRVTRADAIAANVAPDQVSPGFQSPRAAAEAAAHATSAVTAQMRATGEGPQAASLAVAEGSDRAGIQRAAAQGRAGRKEAAGGIGAEDGLRELATAADAPADATATIDDADPVSWAARNFNLRG